MKTRKPDLKPDFYFHIPDGLYYLNVEINPRNGWPLYLLPGLGEDFSPTYHVFVPCHLVEFSQDFEIHYPVYEFLDDCGHWIGDYNLGYFFEFIPDYPPEGLIQ